MRVADAAAAEVTDARDIRIGEFADHTLLAEGWDF